MSRKQVTEVAATDPDEVAAADELSAEQHLFLMRKIEEVTNLAVKLDIRLEEECMLAMRKVLAHRFEMDDLDIQIFSKNYIDGPTSIQ